MSNNYFLEKIKKTNIETFPYNHIDIGNVLEAELYEKISNELNNMDLKLFNRISEKIIRYQIEIKDQNSYKINNLPFSIRNFILFLFNIKDDLFNILSSKIITEKSKKNYSLSIYLAKDCKGFWIGPHPDNSINIFTCLLYLPINNNNEKLGTELYSRIVNNCSRCGETCCSNCNMKNKNIKNVNEKNNFRLEKTVNFLKNRFLAFAPGKNTWHGVREITEIDNTRNSIQFLFLKK